MNASTTVPTRRRRVAASAATIALATCGVVALSQPASAVTVSRIGGADRIETAIKVWEQNRDLFAKDRVMLARQDVYADALAAAPAADLAATPILVTTSGQLDDRVLAALKRQGIKNVGIIGGPQAISANVVKTLEDNGMATARIAGDDRFETARLMADTYLKASGKTSAPAYVAAGTNFPDALAAGAAAAEAGGYVLLSIGDKLDPDTAGYLKSGKASSSVAVGGPAVKATRAAGVSATPIMGPTRYETAVALAEHTFNKPANAVVASGQTFADSLAGGALAGRLNAPLLLTPPHTTNVATQKYLSAVKPNLHVLGGPVAVSDAVLDALSKAVTGGTPTPTPSPTTTPPSTGGGGGGGGGTTTPSVSTVLAPIAGETARSAASGTSSGGGTVTTDNLVTVDQYGSYVIKQDYAVTAPSGQVPLSDTVTLTSTLRTQDGDALNLTQTVAWTSMARFDATGSTASATVRTSSGGGVEIVNPSFDFKFKDAAPSDGTRVTATVTSTINGAPAGTKSVTAEYRSGGWVRVA